MATTLSPRSRRSSTSWLLWAGVVLFAGLAAFTTREVWRAFDERAGQARAAAVFDLVSARTAVRPTDAPGAMAWLRRAIERSGLTDRTFAEPGDAFPEPLARIASVIRSTDHSDGGDGRPPFLAAPTGSADSVRAHRIVRFRGQSLVVTRRRTLETDAASQAFVVRATPVLTDRHFYLHNTLGGQEPMARDVAPARVVRLYAVNDDGTLLSLPVGKDAGSAADANAIERELAVLSTRPTLPGFAPEEFFFRSAGDSYSGFYLDLGGQGLVSTLTTPLRFPDGTTQGIFALDLAFTIDWGRLADSLEPPIAGAAVSVTPGASTSWTSLERALPVHASSELRSALAEASRRTLSVSGDSDGPLRHAVVANGAIAAFQVSERTWLLAWFPQVAPAFPFAALGLLTVLLVALLAGFEFNRRRAAREQESAERALTEKQNLLNTMQVPLVVVDPNSDAIVSANRAADIMGFRAGRRFADLVWPDPRARAQYERMQVASLEPRRAYGIPVAVLTDDGRTERRYAVVRSVAVTAPIAALQADERHRLGVIVVLDESTDLALLLDDVTAAAHRHERRRLAGLLSHGVDTLARVLDYTLAKQIHPELSSWLAEYLERRVGVTAWLLDHWDESTPTGRESIIDSNQARATLERFQLVFNLVAEHRELRQRLHWDNGTLAGPTGRAVHATFDWPADAVVSCPVHGGFGLFLSELLINAVRHGSPGTTPALTISCDRVRGELVCEIRNSASGPAPSLEHLDPYGGLAIVQTMSRLFEWPIRQLGAEDSTFVASWTMPIGTRQGTEAD